MQMCSLFQTLGVMSVALSMKILTYWRHETYCDSHQSGLLYRPFTASKVLRQGSVSYRVTLHQWQGEMSDIGKEPLRHVSCAMVTAYEQTMFTVRHHPISARSEPDPPRSNRIIGDTAASVKTSILTDHHVPMLLPFYPNSMTKI